MFFVFTKILFIAFSPFNLAIWLLLGALAAFFYAKNRVGLTCLSGTALIFLLGGILPTGQLALRLLQGATPPPTERPKQVDGIILLGGFLDTRAGFAHDSPQFDGAVDRLNHFVDLANTFPNAKLLFTGGLGNLGKAGTPEATMLPAALQRFKGNIPTRLTYDSQARNTYENAKNARNILKPKADETWLLVTSAWHMPRALGTFRAAGWQNIIPAPTDYIAPTNIVYYPQPGGFLTNMAYTQLAFREIGGILIYALTNKWSPK